MGFIYVILKLNSNSRSPNVDHNDYYFQQVLQKLKNAFEFMMAFKTEKNWQKILYLICPINLLHAQWLKKYIRYIRCKL